MFVINYTLLCLSHSYSVTLHQCYDIESSLVSFGSGDSTPLRNVMYYFVEMQLNTLN